MHIGAVLLAAGASNRLGRPKQLVVYQGLSLVRRAALSLIESGCKPVVVVAGACAEVFDEVRDLNVFPVRNDKWADGIASSIRAGLCEALCVEGELDAILISVCDQPLITGVDLSALRQFFVESQRPVAAAQFGSTLGVPAIFRRELFDRLLELEGDSGARRILQEQRSMVAAFPLSNAEYDVDRLEDLERLEQE